MPKEEVIPTRGSLLKRIANWRDEASWEDFYKTYRNLIYGVARHAGLNDAEAEDVVQETMVSVARNIHSFTYDPSAGSFKTWLLNMTRWRIIDRRRQQGKAGKGGKIDFMELEIPDGRESIEEYWEREWEKTLLEGAKLRVKRRIDPAKYQIFDLCVTRELPAKKVAERLRISVDEVYQAKHRVAELIKKEAKRLAKEGL